MDEAFFQEMLEAVPDVEPSARDPYLTQDLYFWLEDAAYATPYGMERALFDAPESATAEQFYAVQWEETQVDLESQGLSQGEKDYWADQASCIQKPYVYREPWIGKARLFDCSYTFFTFLPVAAAVCLCTLFSEDRRKRVESLVFSTRTSRTPLYLAKLFAGVTVAALAAVVIVGSVLGVMVFLWGWEGFDAPIQLYDIFSPRPITVGQAILAMLLMLVLFTLLYGGVAMLLSAATHSPMAALAGPAMLSFLLGMVQVPKEAGVLKNLWRDNLIGYGGFSNLHLVNVFGVYLNDFQYGPILYLTIMILLLALCWPFWRRSAEGKV